MIIADRNSDCDYCNLEIQEDTQIDKRNGWGWVHASAEHNCAKAIDEEELAYDQRNIWNQY